MAGYIGTTPVPQATQHRESFTATGGQTSFATVGYTPQFIDVYLNGVKLAPADFTATNGSDVVLASGATASDILEIVAYTPFEVADQTFTGTTTAANLTVTGAFTSQGIDDNADATAITIDSSENVGIGTSSPAATLHVDNGSGSALYVGLANNIYSRGTEHIWQSLNNASEYMRIDSSGNLLVGTTNTNIVASSTATDEGFVYVNGSALTAARSSGQVADFNRITNDGEIIRLRKDGTTVGSIGTQAGTLQIDGTSGSTGLLFGASNIYPRDNGANSDGGVDIGGSSIRFKDLYLSGGVYLGGTGSANKLDDYEEGSWVIGTNGDATGVIAANSYGLYVKIGQLVYIQGVFQVSTNFTSNSIDGLPFVPINNSALVSSIHGQGNLRYQNSNGAITLSNNSDVIGFSDSTGSNVVPTTSNDPFRFSATYRTTS